MKSLALILLITLTACAVQSLQDDKIINLEIKQQQLDHEQSYLDKKLEVLNQEQSAIDELYNQDDAKFVECIGTQQSMIDTLDHLIAQINNDLQHAKVLIQKSDLFEDLKKIGKGKHVEVLAQITAHLDQDLIEKILTLFGQLRQSTLNSIAEDQAEQESNIALYKALRAEIARLIDSTNSQNDNIKNQPQEQQAQTAFLQTQDF